MQVPQVEPFLGAIDPFELPVCVNMVLSRALANKTTLHMEAGMLLFGGEPSAVTNRSIGAITSTSGACSLDWRGPMVAHANVGRDILAERCRDVNMADFRHIADMLISYVGPQQEHVPSVPASIYQSRSHTVQGVRINCIGDQVMFNKLRFEQVSFSRADSLFFTDSDCNLREVMDYNPSDNSRVDTTIGIALNIRRCFPHPNWATPHKLDGYHILYANLDAMKLFYCFDFASDARGSHLLMSAVSDNVLGTIMVVRKDKKALSVAHIEALCCHVEALRKMKGKPIPSRASYTKFWANWCEEKRKKGERMFDATSPYDA
ncbi:hypothetical protein GGR57DRAFT_499394 [Xylariaceae sp. FL1272]|nr:hypothetical protein GGR57DRAFT_499394 [Xylariaceae sp. FL1272]